MKSNKIIYSSLSGIPARRTRVPHEEHTFCVCNECELKRSNAGNPRSKSIKSLSVDTSFDHCSFALQIGNDIIEYCELTPKTHTQVILSMLQKILDDANIKLKELDFIAFAKGPGSFTSVRIAASLVQGIAFGVNLPVVSVSTLQAMAEEAHDKYGAEQVLAGMDARMGEIYWGVYKFDNNGISTPVIKDELIKPENVIYSLTDEKVHLMAAGNAWSIYGDILKNRLPQKIDIKKELFPRAKYVAKLGFSAYSSNNFGDWHDAVPIYLRNDVTN